MANIWQQVTQTKRGYNNVSKELYSQTCDVGTDFNTNTTKYNKEKNACLNPLGRTVISDKMFKSGQVISAAHIPPFMLILNIPFEHKAVSTKRSNLSPAPDDLKADWQLMASKPNLSCRRVSHFKAVQTYSENQITHHRFSITLFCLCATEHCISHVWLKS